MKRSSVWFAVLCLLLGCEKPKNYTTTLEILQVQAFGSDPKNGLIEIEARYADCPGDGRRVMRIDKQYASCLRTLVKGDKPKADLVFSYNPEKTSYRCDVVKIGDCPVVLDPKEDANFESYQSCSDLKASGSVVGVTCDRQRTAATLAKCPFLKRR